MMIIYINNTYESVDKNITIFLQDFYRKYMIKKIMKSLKSINKVFLNINQNIKLNTNIQWIRISLKRENTNRPPNLFNSQLNSNTILMIMSGNKLNNKSPMHKWKLHIP